MLNGLISRKKEIGGWGSGGEGLGGRAGQGGFGGPIINSPQVTALGRLSSQANHSMGYTRVLARAVSNPGLPNCSFDGINTMSFTTLLSAQMVEWQKT